MPSKLLAMLFIEFNLFQITPLLKNPEWNLDESYSIYKFISAERA